MNKQTCLEQDGPLLKAYRQQYQKNSQYISDFIKLRNELLTSTSQLIMDYQDINKSLEGFIKQLEDGTKIHNNRQEDNMRKVVLEYQLSDGLGLQMMDNLQRELQRTFVELHVKLYPYDENKVQFFNFDEYRDISECQEFKQFQESKYIQNQNVFYDMNEVRAAEISPDEKYLVIIAEDSIVIWDYQTHTLLQRYDLDTSITTFTFEYPSNNIIFGDAEGMVHKIFIMNDLIGHQEGFKVHEHIICFILLKQKDQIYTCSKDNTIHLIDLTKNQILHTLNYLCPCRSNFVYAALNEKLIVPNGNQISIFNPQSDKQLNAPCEFDIEEDFLSMLLSKDEKDLYLNLPHQDKINNYFIDYKAKEVKLTRVFMLYTYFYNFSLCFNDKVLVLLSPECFEFRHLDDEDVSLIKEIRAFGTETFFFNQQHPKLNKLVTIRGYCVIVYERVLRN